jgi:hypothetical protein
MLKGGCLGAEQVGGLGVERVRSHGYVISACAAKIEIAWKNIYMFSDYMRVVKLGFPP